MNDSSKSQVDVVLNGRNYFVEFQPDRHIKIVGQRRQFDLSAKNNAISQYSDRWVKIDPHGKLGQKILLEAQKKTCQTASDIVS